MKSFNILLISVLSGFIEVQASYTIVDSENTLKSYIPYILNETNNYFKIHSNFPDMLDKETRFEHLSLINNEWAKVDMKNTSVIITEFEADPKNSTIRIKLTNPATYEIKTEYVYTYTFITLSGNATIKGAITEAQILLKVTNIPPHITGIRKKFIIEPHSVNLTVNYESIKLQNETSWTKRLKIKEFIEKVIRSNLDVLDNNFKNATKNATDHIFSVHYPNEDHWYFTLANEQSSWNVTQYIDNLYIDKSKALVAVYKSDWNSSFDNASLLSIQPVQPETARRFSLGIDLVKKIIKELFGRIKRLIEDEDLPEEMVNRLDIKTFQKIVPEAAIKSITKLGYENNKVNMILSPKSELIYFLGDERTPYILASCNYSLINYGLQLNAGSVLILFQIASTWKKEGPIGYLNFKLDKVEVIGWNIDSSPADIYMVESAQLDDFMYEFTEAHFSKIRGRELIKKGIPIGDTIIPYEETVIRWDNSTAQIIVEHY